VIYIFRILKITANYQFGFVNGFPPVDSMEIKMKTPNIQG